MSFVSGRFLADFLRSISRVGIGVEVLVGDLPLEWSGQHHRYPLVEWDIFVELMRRLERQVGGAEGLQDLGEFIADAKPAPILRRLAGITASPSAVYRAALKWALPRAIPVIDCTTSTLEDGRIQIIAKIAPGNRPCPQLFHVAAGSARALPRILDLPDAVVSAEVGDDSATFNILPPPSGTLTARARRALRAFFSSRAALHQLELQQLELQEHIDALARSYADIQQSEARHRALTDSLIDVMVEMSGDGQVHFVSRSVEDLTGYRADQVVGSNFSLWLHRDDAPRAKQIISKILEYGRASNQSAVFRLRRQSGQWVWVEVTAQMFLTGGGDAHLVAVLRDVSGRVSLAERQAEHRQHLEQEVAARTELLERRNRDLRELQALLLEAERQDAARDLAGHIAHSINNRLGALILHLESATLDGSMNGRDLADSLDLAKRISEVVHRTLDMYREGKINRAPVKARDLMAELQDDLVERAAHFGIRLEFWLDERLTTFEVDRSLLISGLLSIAENAIDVMHEGGRLGVETRLSQDASTVEIQIWDTGPGFPEELRRTVFDAFFTTKSKGTGLGLAIARGVVHGHGGRIDIGEHTEGGGLVIVQIPRVAPTNQSPPRAERGSVTSK